jgi:hypothetical protein
MTKNYNKLTNNHSTFLFIVVVLLIFALITSIVAIILAVKNKKTETFKLKQNNSETPSGTIISYGGISVLDGYLSCDGKDYKSSDYPELFKVIGTTFGSGDASKSTDFNVPNLINRYVKGGTKSSNNIEGQNNFLVKNENIQTTQVDITEKDLIAFQKDDFSQLPYTLDEGGTGYRAIKSSLNKEEDSNYKFSNIRDSLTVGTGKTPINNRPFSINSMFLIKF